MTGGKLPAIVWDGVTKYGDKTEAVRIVVREKPEVGFINLGLAVTPPDMAKARPSMKRRTANMIGPCTKAKAIETSAQVIMMRAIQMRAPTFSMIRFEGTSKTR